MGEKKRSLILLVSALLIVGFLATSLASYYVSRSSLRAQITLSELPLTSDTIYSEIQRDLLQPVLISSMMAHDTLLRDWIIEGERNENDVTRYLEEIRKRYAMVTAFLVSDRTQIYYHADGILKRVSEDEKRDEWYYNVRAMEPDYEINVDLDMANKDTLTIFINYKIYDYDENFLGATGVGITLDSIMQRIEDYQERYNRRVYFVDREGYVTFCGPSFDSDVGNINGMEGLSSISKEILSSESATFQYTAQGKITHLNTRFVPDLQLYLFVEQTEKEATRKILNALVINLILCAIITAIVLALTNLTIAAYQRRLEKMATTDEMTGLLNRQAFDIVFKQTYKNIQRNPVCLSLVMLDIDLFKQVNDTYGHLAGDTVIRGIAEVTQGEIRSSDVLCRWGGEEFLVLLQDCPIERALTVAEKIREAIKAKIFRHEGVSIYATVSLGVAQYHASEDEDTLLSRVDRALYVAKEKGRDRVEREILVDV